MSSFERLSVLEQQRIKLEEAQMKKKVIEEKKKKELEAKAKEEKLKQQQESKLQKQSAVGQQSLTINSNVKESNKKSSLPPTGQGSVQKRPNSALKPSDQGNIRQAKDVVQNKQAGPVQMLKKVISLEDIEEQRAEIEPDSDKYQQEKPKEIKNAYNNVVVKEYQKEEINVKDKYLMQLQIQEQMKKIQKTQELKQQQAKQKNMLMKQQVIEEMLNQTNQDQKQNQTSNKNAQAGYKDSSNQHDKQYRFKQEDQNDVEKDDLNDTLDYNQNNKNQQRIYQERQSQNFKVEQKGQKNQQQNEQNENSSENQLSQMYPVDSLNQLPPLKSIAQTSNTMIDKNNQSQKGTSNRAQMVQSQNYVGEEEIISNYPVQNRESVISNKASTNNGISDSVQRSKLETQKKSSSYMTGQAKMPESFQKSNVSNSYQSKIHNKSQSNSIQKTEFENNSGKNSKQFEKADASIKVSQLNKSIRDQIFQDEIDYTESVQVDAQYPFLEKQSKSHQKNNQNKSFSVQESQERVSKVQNQDKQKQSSFLKQKNKKNKYSSSPCIQQEDFDESDQEEETNQQQNTSNFNFQNKNNSKFSNDSQNLNNNLSAASNGSQRFLKSSAQNERFPIFNKGSQIQNNQDQEDSETECKKQSLKNLSDKSFNKQSASKIEEFFENECQEDKGDNTAPKVFQTFKSNPIQLQGNFYNSNYNNQDSNEEEEQIENQGEEEEDFDGNQENQFEQTEFEDIGNNYAAPQKLMNEVKGMNKQNSNDNQLKQLSDYSDQQDDAQDQSEDDKEELQDEASLSTKLQGSKQTNEEPMIVSFGVQNQQSFGKQNNLNESQKQRQNIKKNSYEDDSLNENFQTFGARDSDKFLGMAINHTKQQKSVELRKSQKPSQDFNDTQKLPYCDQTAQFNEEVNPFKQLKQQMRQVKQNQQINKQDLQKNQEFDRKRQDILKDAEDNIKKVMNDQIRMADSNKFKFSEQEESESPLNNQSYKSGISQNKSAQTRAQLLDNMRKKKDSKQEINGNSQQYNQDKFLSQPPSRPQFITQSNISELKHNNQTLNNNNSDKMSTPDQQSFLKNSFDLKFQEAYEQQYDQSCNSQMIEGSPIQFVKNQNDIYQKYNNVNQERDSVLKKSQQADSKSISVVHKPNYDEENEEDFWQKQKQTENKKRKVWGNQKPNQQIQDKQFQMSDKLSQSIGQTSNVMPNQSNYHSKLQKLHESEEFQDNEFIELTLKQKIQDQNLQNSYEQADNYRNEQPKLWATRNINAGSNRGGYKGYSYNGNQLEMEREEEDQEDYDQSQGYSQNYNNQYRNHYDDDDEEDQEQEDQNDEDYSQNYQNNYYNQQQYYEQEYDDQDQDQNASNYNDNYQQENDDDNSYNQYQNKNKGFQNQRNTYKGQNQRHHHKEENDDESADNNSQTNQDNNIQLNDDNSDNFSPQKQDKSLNESNEENNLNQNNKSSKQEDEEEEQKQIQKGVAMTIDFGDKDDDELERKKKAFEIKRLKKIQELEMQKQKKQQEIQQKQLLQADDQLSGQKERKQAHKKQPSYQIQQRQKAQQDGQARSENNTPSNKQQAKKANENQNQFAKNQQNIFSVNQRDQIINQNSPKSKSPVRQQPVKEKVKLPVINKKKENIEEENKSDLQENFTPKISVLENPTTKPRIPFSKPSNKQLISQAITKVCLAGPTNSKEREIALKKIKDSQQEHFIVLFKGINGRQDFKALYSMDSNTNEVKKIFGLNTAPTQIDLASVQAFYRYDSGSKEFKEILVKAFSNQVDAVLLKK
ncbi:microtubule-binding calmodulin-regulated spectrin-associated protein (macronuclear) [Tetrahymena thermophila SB210]|uniref:Microtubule-binding calmodulin-regulated spectrin-associated protein n=1 Tax=Tetrahymena thermophila (strain SB210) TaxID=312017 RepID=Q22NV2_TETTS|nr:microtubule-binding calmodulin-regulated spectrin-associated protein [Tetrahymena thermophila SB210]EAR87059.1 microtubule-binding calmodulin-regulated spectrin-associated protein [Tetrahymena thermophila SB210]|eukprot:XP_001007304.1 microtubule-binding calmodulin-regulated spectrin-associated protein [Tetrahymena thermophila SB210]